MKKAVLPLVLLLVFALTGCEGGLGLYTNFREVERIKLIRTLGIDESGGIVTVTAGTGRGQNGEEPLIYVEEDETVAAAVRELEKNSMKYDAVFSHTEHVVIGEEAARAGVEGYLDFVGRSMQMRLATYLFVVKGGTANELITGARGASSAATDMLTTMVIDAPLLGGGYVPTCGDAASGFAEEGCALIQAVELRPSDEWSADEEYMAVLPAGYAVMHNGRLIDFVPDDEARGVGIITGTARSDVMTAEVEGKKVTLLLNHSGTKVRPYFEEDGLRIELEVDIKLNVQEIELPDGVLSAESRRRISQVAAEREYGLIQAALARSQALGVDYLGLGTRVRMKEPVKFAPFEDRWEECFPTVPVDITVKAELMRTYDTDDPIDYSGEDDGGA